jgi:phosphoglycolate phosphatase
MPIKNLIFDLDGTLIDSSNSILESFRGAFEKVGKAPVRPLTADIIGPPLRETLSNVSGLTSSDELDGLATAFKAYYDTEGYKHTEVFPDIEEILSELSRMQLSLYIATNKRIIPTRLILDHLGWTSYFTGVYALDSLTASMAQKSDLLKYIVDKYSMNSESTLYVGDRREDGEAAAKNHLKFAFAAWGYGMDIKMFEGSGDFYLEHPVRLVEHLDS